jgi:hypothetical protein
MAPAVLGRKGDPYQRLGLAKMVTAFVETRVETGQASKSVEISSLQTGLASLVAGIQVTCN